jgi:hypothetical protein
MMFHMPPPEAWKDNLAMTSPLGPVNEISPSFGSQADFGWAHVPPCEWSYEIAEDKDWPTSPNFEGFLMECA